MKSNVLSQVSLPSAAERDRVVFEWNATDAVYPSDRCIDELFEEQASCDPDAIAADRIVLRQPDEIACLAKAYEAPTNIVADFRV